MKARARHRPRGARDLRGTCTRIKRELAERMSRAVVGQAIRRVRLEIEVAATELAAACGVSRRTVHHWEAGHRGMSAGRLRQVADALGVPVDHLI